MSIVLDGTSGVVVSGNTNTLSGITVGKGAGSVSTNTAVGASALAANTSGGANTSLGYQALAANTTSSRNTAVGYVAGTATTTGHITAFGAYALYANTTGTGNTALGGNDEGIAAALQSNTTGGSNTAVGTGALTSNTTSSQNTAVGYQAAYSSTTGFGDVNAFGWKALYSNTTGYSNTAMGSQALYSNTTAANNTAVGYQAGYSNTGTQGVFIGGQAGYSNTTANGSTHVGYLAGYSVTTGSYNALLGQGAGYYITTGSKNSILGGFNGNQSGLDIRTASNYIVLSDGDGNPRCLWDGNGMGQTKGGGNGSYAFQVVNTGNSTPYGLYIQYNSATPNGTINHFIYAEDSTALRFGVRSNGGVANYSANNSNLSDIREKKNIELAGSYLDKICAIPVKTFLFNDQTDEDLNLGVIAQDVQAVAPELVVESNWAKEGDEPKMRLSIYQTDLQYALMKALQELKAEFDAYKESHP